MTELKEEEVRIYVAGDGSIDCRQADDVHQIIAKEDSFTILCQDGEEFEFQWYDVIGFEFGRNIPIVNKYE